MVSPLAAVCLMCGLRHLKEIFMGCFVSGFSDFPVWVAEPVCLAPGHGPEAVQIALAWIEAQGQRQGWPSRALMVLGLCADEALSNIAAYAHTPEGQAASMWLCCGATAEGLALRIEDNGTTFDPTAQTSPDLAFSLDEARPGGHGLRLMRHHLRRLAYRRVGARNMLLMEL